MPAATFLQLQQRLFAYWEEQGCVALGSCDRPLRIGTLSPASFLRILDPVPWSSVQGLINRCPRESRREPSPLRLSYRHQLHVILRPPPKDPLDLLRQSLRSAGFDLRRRDVQFANTDFTVPEVGLTGAGWRLRLEGLPVAHAYYPQALHGQPLPSAVELGYELERLVMLQHGSVDIDQLPWSAGVTYESVAGQMRRGLDRYYTDRSEKPERLSNELDRCFAEAERSLAADLRAPAYDQFLRCCEVLEILRVRQNLGPLREQTWLERLADLSWRCLPEAHRQ